MRELPAELLRILGDLNVDHGDGGLLTRALTHRSWVHERVGAKNSDNERLEFLGDAVVELAVSQYLYEAFPDSPEGDLARMRAAIVREESLAACGRRLGLGDALRLGIGEAKSGGRARNSLLANAYEAVIGSIYLDHGWSVAHRAVLTTLAPELGAVASARSHVDAKSALQEFLQARSGTTPQYRLVKEKGPDHDKEFVSEVVHAGERIGLGEGRSKKAAEQAAAEDALRRMNRATTASATVNPE